MVLLRRDHRRTQHVAAGLRIEIRVGRHELGGFENHVAVAVERFAVGMRAVAQLGHGDGVRLLPDEQRADVGRAVASVGRGHFRPARAGVSLDARLFARGGQDGAVPAQAALEQRRAAPQGEVRGVPKVHFQMELAEPAIAGEAGFLRRERAGALNGRLVLRKHDAAFQFLGARVAAAGEIHRAAAGPEAAPVLAAGRQSFLGGGKWSRSPACPPKLTDEIQAVSRRPQHKPVRPFALHFAGRLPGNADGVSIAVELAGDVEPVRAAGRFRAPVLFRMAPVGGVHGARAVRKLEADRHAAADPHRQQVELGMASRLHHHPLAVPLELAVQYAGPQVERLPGCGDVAGLFDRKADLSQVQPVRVLAQPVEQCHLPVRAGGIPDLAPVGIEHGQPQIRGALSARVGNGMPAPLRHGAERHLPVVERRESLQAGGVGRECELAVAHRERGPAVERAEHRVVTLHQRAPVDCGPGGLRAQGRGRRAEKLTPGESHCPDVLNTSLPSASPRRRPPSFREWPPRRFPFRIEGARGSKLPRQLQARRVGIDRDHVSSR